MIREPRFDFRGGVNRTFSPDVIDQTECHAARNLELVRYGGLSKLPSTHRIHDTVLAGPVLGLHHWIGPEGSQIVAVANGKLWKKGEADADFTEVTDGDSNPVAFSTTARAWFAQHTQFGSPELYIADGTLWKFDGVSVEAVDGAPEDVVYIEVYKGRMYATDGSKTVYWSAVADPEEWSSVFDAGQANAETYEETGLTGAQAVGGSLLLFKRNSVARFTGVSKDDIRLDQQTEGISADVGCVAPKTIVRLEEACFFLSDRGPYLASEMGVQPIGVKIEREFQVEDVADWLEAVATHHRGHRQVWLHLPDGDVWIYDYRVSAWTGPHEFPWETTAMAMYEKSDGTESILLAGSDGWVREQKPRSEVHRHDRTRAGTGGSPIVASLELRDLIFTDPSLFKSAHGSQEVACDLGEGGRLLVETAGDECPTREVAIPSRGSGAQQYRFRPAWRGRRLQLTLTEESDHDFDLFGLILQADPGRVGV